MNDYVLASAPVVTTTAMLIYAWAVMKFYFKKRGDKIDREVARTAANTGKETLGTVAKTLSEENSTLKRSP